MSRCTLTIDGRTWIYDRGCWRRETSRASITVVTKSEDIVGSLAEIYGASEWPEATLTDHRGREWVYDSGDWVWTHDDYVVRLRIADGRWHVCRYGFGIASTELGLARNLSLDDVLDAMDRWLAGLWGNRVGDLLWSSEYDAYIGVLGRWMVELYDTANGWCAEVSDESHVQVVKTGRSDPRVAYAELEAIYGETQ